MTTLIIAEHDNGTLNDAVEKCLSAARALEGDQGRTDILVAGHECADVAAAAAALNGVARVRHADDPTYAHPRAEVLSALVLSLAEEYDNFFAAATSHGKDFMPRIAAALDVAQISEIIEVCDPNSFKRPIYAGNAIELVESGPGKKVITVRATAFPAAGAAASPAPIEAVAAAEDPGLSRHLSAALTESERPELSSARIVVSGGRGLGSAENFRLLESLADKLNAAVGASRAAVDAGYVSNDFQVGQTGKVVAPDLYIAIGISGAIQHLAGMKDSKIIVAINKDEEAPIFQIADYGWVADLFEAVPQLEAALAQGGE